MKRWVEWPKTALSNLEDLLGKRRVSTAAEDMERYGRDWSSGEPSMPGAVVFPDSVAQVQALIRWAGDQSIPLVPSGGRTGLSAGAVAAGGEVVVSLERMHKVLGFDSVDRALTVEAGVVTRTVQEFAGAHGLFYGVDFASRDSSQIGGNIATNAGGIRVLRYGLTREWVTGMKVVTGTGEILELNRGLTKNASGYDLRHFFIGSEGTLGIVVEATLRLTEPPPVQQVIVLGVAHLDGLMQVFAGMRRRLKLSAFEFFTDIALRHVLETGAQRPFESNPPYYVLAEFDEDEAAALAVFESLSVDGFVVDGVVGQSLAQNADLWRLREGITESLARCRPYKNDISVRVALIPRFLARMQALFEREYPMFEVVWFGHIGDGNLHVSILPPEDWSRDAFVAECQRVTHMLCEVLEEFGGSISAEHGIGLLKRQYLHYTRSSAEIELMRQMKQVFDPAGIMNPGKLFPP